MLLWLRFFPALEFKSRCHIGKFVITVSLYLLAYLRELVSQDTFSKRLRNVTIPIQISSTYERKPLKRQTFFDRWEKIYNFLQVSLNT